MMSDLIESSEFGDWLLGEISKAAAQSKSANPDRALAAKKRLQTLKIAKKILLEFLTLQQAMLEAASAARRHRAMPGPCNNGSHDSVLTAGSVSQ